MSLIIRTILLTILFVLALLLILKITKETFKYIIKKNNAVHLHYIHSIVNVLIIAIVVYTYTQMFEVTKEISKTLLQSGSLIIAIATFAAQQSLGNLISGFMISATKPFEIGQKVKIVDGGNIIAEGIIKDISIRHTVIKQYDGEICIVPNSTMDSCVIVNANYDSNVGNFIEVTIPFSSNVSQAKKIIEDICIHEPVTLNTESNKALIKGFTDDGVTLKIAVWTKTLDENFTACSNIREKIIEEFHENGIEISYKIIKLEKI